MKALKLIAILAALSLLAVACKKSNATSSNTSGTKAAGGTKSATKPVTPKLPASMSGFKAVKPKAESGNLYMIDDTGMQFELPQGWTLEDGEGQVAIAAPDGSISVIFMVVEMEDIQAALAGLQQGIKTSMQNVTVDPEQEAEANGMKVYFQGGTGEAEGTKLVWSASIIDAPGKPILAFTTMDPERGPAHAAESKQFLASIKPVGGAKHTESSEEEDDDR
ncbi:MAG TPA: hypothetical protein VNN73_13710 [Blastocatellia bacterium]|nr:hypothetical protein [Blastocatellia bacterium]